MHYNRVIVRNKEFTVSAISNLLIDVQERIDEGQEPYRIAVDLGIPLHWVYEALEIMQEEDCSPFATINS